MTTTSTAAFVAEPKHAPPVSKSKSRDALQHQKSLPIRADSVKSNKGKSGKSSVGGCGDIHGGHRESDEWLEGLM